ncbi:MAG: ABC-type branched-chain amino acid transport system, permease component [Candidatus Methanohalarchaeum thermophilum]|uniref:ABC-type branched-chain amino acid transport system, permease component n=1 Tax=Methanohalarchaeum thermophilum TaxID=1903181 RepID=A0A1Q6DXN4_METT1|nr:MAG: ABC-type branched-chain amino acid transport system, permease component [Candidatus Methanohalarchaeum thermophilum]
MMAIGISYIISLLILFGIYAIFALGLNLEWGFTGILNFGHVAFFGIGAYSTVILNQMGVPIYIAIVAGIIIAGLFGVLVALPAMRLRGDYFAIVTIGFSEIVRYFMLNEEWLTGGPLGLRDFDIPLSFVPSQYYNIAMLILVLALLALTYLILKALINSPWGRVLKSIREDEDVSKALGKNVFRYKIQSIALGSAIAGLAGILLAFNHKYLNPNYYMPLITFYAWIIVILGGSGNNKGTILGALIFWTFMSLTRFSPGYLPISSTDLGALRMVIIGLLLIVLMMYKPEGLLGNKEELKLDI